MEKDWLTVIIVILMIGIALDGLRRMRKSRRENLRLSRNAQKADLDGDPSVGGSEFPSGGARVAGYREETEAKSLNKTVKETFAAKRVTKGAPQRIPQQVALNLEESVPMLMDSVEMEERALAEERAPHDPVTYAGDNNVQATRVEYHDDEDYEDDDDERYNSHESHDHDGHHDDEKYDDEDSYEDNEYEAPRYSSRDNEYDDDEYDRDDDESDEDEYSRYESDTRNYRGTPVNRFSTNEDEDEDEDHREPQLGNFNDLDDDDAERKYSIGRGSVDHEPYQAEPARAEPVKSRTESKSAFGGNSLKDKKPSREAAKKAQQEVDDDRAYKEPDEVLIMNIMAKPGYRFNGEDLLQALMDEGLKLGAMDIFHRHLNNDGDAPVLFSLANMVVPGTFNLSEMQSFQTPGVSMFLSLPVEGESLAAYNDLARTARNLADKLDGELKDENRSVMTNQTIEHGRQRVMEYERKRKLARV